MSNVILLALFVSGELRAQPSAPLSVTLEKTTISSGEPVLLRVSVKNTSYLPLEIDFGTNAEDDILISVIDPDGKRHDKPPPPPPLGMTFFGWQHLDSGEEFSQVLVLNKWFDFKKTGEYHIDFQLKKPPTIGSQPVSIQIPTLILNVTAYNPETLASVCHQFTAAIKKQNTPKESLRAATAERALSYINDPVAVPCWSQVLEYADGLAISSLRKIGTLEAVTALTRALRLHNKETRSQARLALRSLAQESSDPAVRAQAARALNNPF